MTGQSAKATAKPGANIEPFLKALARSRISLTRERTRTLQINMGLVCNQACRHCHLMAGPLREEAMDRRTAREAADYAIRGKFEAADLTGGAPELNPNLNFLIERLAASVPRVMLRANLTALTDGDHEDLIELLVGKRVVIIASFPSLSPSQAEAQRCRGVFDRSINALKRLNALGYGRSGTGLELDLVSNPSGAFLPPAQAKVEERFRRLLEDRFGVVFNNLFTFANVPLGRFRQWLEESGNYEDYIKRLAQSFNSCAVEGVMCRSQVSVAWDGYLYDCDFNLAAGLPLGGKRTHIKDMTGPPEPGAPIAAGDHCYTCTAGAGFT